MRGNSITASGGKLRRGFASPKEEVVKLSTLKAGGEVSAWVGAYNVRKSGALKMCLIGRVFRKCEVVSLKACPTKAKTIVLKCF